MSSAVSIRRQFLSWERPWLEQVVRWLAGSWTGGQPLDLSELVAVVPTRQAGRRLREALASFAGEQGQAVFAPRVLTPEALTSADGQDGVATRLESLLAWVHVLRECDLAEYRRVFPIDPPARNFAWALQLAFEFHRLQVALAEGGLLLTNVTERVGADFVEAERWREIAELGELHATQLAAVGRRDPHAARRETRELGLLAGRARVVVLAVPDLQPLAAQRLEEAARVLPVEVLVCAPETEAEEFDGWGRPREERWRGRELVLRDFATRVQLCADPAAQAARIAALAQRYPQPEGTLALGIADPEITPLLETELGRVGCAVFNPDGRSAQGEALFQLLTQLAELVRDPAFATVQALARCPAFFSYLAAKLGGEFTLVGWLEGLDELHARHLPADLAAAQRWAGRLTRFPLVERGLAAMSELRRVLARGTFAEGATETLRQIFAARRLEGAEPEDAWWQEVAGEWMTIVRECAAAEERFGALPAAEGWELALRLFGDRRLAETKPVGALELQGWLELLWEDAPHLVLAGCNDGRVPESLGESGFLPESLRERLGLDTSGRRFARDAYLLQAMAAMRAAAGQLDLLVGKTTAAGDPLRPSRLLLRCPDTELPARIAHLFRALEPADAASGWRRTWKLRPRQSPPLTRVTVTALRTYLACPFRFYLRHGLGMQGVDPWKSELDARDFGTLCHAALEKIGLEPALRDCVDARLLRAELLNTLDAAVLARYGRELALPLVVQIEAARQRLGRLAELQAAERAEGWVPVQIERAFEISVAGLAVRGKIDRIDRNERTGELRVLDYKTTDRPVPPPEAHLSPVRTGETVPDWAQVAIEGRDYAWRDLQLPLYLRALESEFPGLRSCGYFNLPKAVGETTLTLWTDYTAELHASAMRCAEGACGAIVSGRYWPPNEDYPANRDECAALFHHGVADSLEWPGA